AMQAVGARFGDQADLAECRHPQIRGVGVGLHLEFLDGIDRGPDRDVAELAGVVAGPVQRDVVLAVAPADGYPRARAARSRSHRARGVGFALPFDSRDATDRGPDPEVADRAAFVPAPVHREVVLAAAPADGYPRARAARSRSHREIEAAWPRRGSGGKQQQL